MKVGLQDYSTVDFSLKVPDILQWYPILQHLHEGGVAGLLHHLRLAFRLLAGVRVEVHLHVSVRLFLQKTETDKKEKNHRIFKWQAQFQLHSILT